MHVETHKHASTCKSKHRLAVANCQLAPHCSTARVRCIASCTLQVAANTPSCSVKQNLQSCGTTGALPSHWGGLCTATYTPACDGSHLCDTPVSHAKPAVLAQHICCQHAITAVALCNPCLLVQLPFMQPLPQASNHGSSSGADTFKDTCCTGESM